MRHRDPAGKLAIFLLCLALGRGYGEGLNEEGKRTESGEGNTYYVSPSGDDSGSGQATDPWRTIQHAADSVEPGDSVFIYAGTYAESVVFHISGAAEAPLTFAAMPGQEAIVEGLEFDPGTAYVKVAQLTVQGFSIWGVFLAGNNHHITLSGLTVTGGEAGVHFTWGDSGQDPEEGPVSDIILENSLIQDCEYTAVDGTPGPCERMVFRNLEITGAGLVGSSSFGADGLAIEKGQDILVEDCYIHDNGGDGIDLNSRDFQGHAPGIVVRRNRVGRNRKNGLKLWGGGRLESNMVWGQGLAPVVIGAFPGTYEVVNNTIAYNMYDPDYSARDYSFVAAYPEEGPSAPIDLTLLNNIFAFNSHDDLGGPTGIYLGEGVHLVKEGFNLYWSREDNEILAEFVGGGREFSRAEIADGTWAEATGKGLGNLTVEPLLKGAEDLHLQAASPCINAGKTAIPNLSDADVDGDSRVIHHIVDLGADEAPPPAVLLQPDLWIKHQGRWRGDEVFNNDGTGQTGRRTVLPGNTAVYRAQLHNDGDRTQTFRIKGPAGDANWTVRYYWGTVVREDREVTSKVTGPQGWKRRHLPPGERRRFLITVTPHSALSKGRFRALVRVQAEGAPAQRDTIRTITRVKGGASKFREQFSSGGVEREQVDHPEGTNSRNETEQTPPYPGRWGKGPGERLAGSHAELFQRTSSSKKPIGPSSAVRGDSNVPGTAGPSHRGLANATDRASSGLRGDAGAQIPRTR